MVTSQDAWDTTELEGRLSGKRNNIVLAALLLAAVVMVAFSGERDHTSRTIVSYSWVPLLLADLVFLRVIFKGWWAIRHPGGRNPFVAVLLLVIPVVNVYGLWSVVGSYPAAFDAYLDHAKREEKKSLGGGAFRIFVLLALAIGPLFYLGSWLGDFRFALRPVAEVLTLVALAMTPVCMILLLVVVARICGAVRFIEQAPKS